MGRRETWVCLLADGKEPRVNKWLKMWQGKWQLLRQSLREVGGDNIRNHNELERDVLSSEP